MNEIGKYIKKVIGQIEREEIKPGDIVYNTKEVNDVIFLEKPDLKLFYQYHKDELDTKYPPFSGLVKYQTFGGEIKNCSIACIVKISKGNFFSEYEIKGTGKKVRSVVKYLKGLARHTGFRVELINTENGYVLKFFGDNQLEVNAFVKQYCKDNIETVCLSRFGICLFS